MELKREGRARVQPEMVDFIALPFPPSKKLKIFTLRGSCAETAKKCTKKRDARAEFFLLTKPVAF